MDIDYRPAHVPLRFCELAVCGKPLGFSKGYINWPGGYVKKRFCSHACANISSLPTRILKTRVPAIEKFWKHIRVEVPDGCWLWTGDTDKEGYGLLRPYGNKGMHCRAHRFSYEYFLGPIPGNLPLDHLCDTPPCVYPYHLEPKTQRANVLRGIGPSAVNARKTHCKRGHPFDEENTRIFQGKYGPGKRCRACANEKQQQRYWDNPEKYRELGRRYSREKA